MFKIIGLIFLGGGLGSILRYFIVKSYSTEKYFYLGTGIVNVLGSILLGYLIVYFSKNVNAKWVPEMGLFLVVGFCGGFTTFSTFANENIQLLLQKQFLSFFLYILLSIVLALLGLKFGMFIAEKIA